MTVAIVGPFGWSVWSANTRRTTESMTVMVDEVGTTTGVVTGSATPLIDVAAGEEFVWALVDAAPDALVMVGADGIIELVNCRTEELFGYERSELLGRPVEDLIPEQSRPVHRAHRTRYRADPTPRAMGAGELLRGLRADGTEFPVEVSLSPVVTAEGRWIVAAVRDVTERLESERHSRDVRHAIDTANEGLFIVDPTTLLFSYVNSAGCAMHGYTEAEMQAMGPLHLAPELEQEGLRAQLAPLMAGEIETVTLRTCALRRDGTEFPVEVLINQPAAADHDGDRPLVAVVRDMTERVHFEQTLAETQTRSEILAERERFGRDLHDTVIGDLFAIGMSLQASLSTAGADGVGVERAEGAVDAIDQVIAKIRKTIFTLNAPIDHGLSVTEQLRQLVDGFEPRLGYTPTMAIEGRIDDLPGNVVEHLLPTVEESLTNVAKHAKSTSAEVHISIDHDRLTVRVTDDGVGLTTGTENNGGLGHGNVRRRATLLAGTCTIEPGQQGGLTVTWTVPLN